MEIMPDKVKVPLAIIATSIGLVACGNENSVIATTEVSAETTLRIIDLEDSY